MTPLNTDPTLESEAILTHIAIAILFCIPPAFGQQLSLEAMLDDTGADGQALLHALQERDSWDRWRRSRCDWWN